MKWDAGICEDADGCGWENDFDGGWKMMAGWSK